MLNGQERHNYYNKYGTLLSERPEACLWKCAWKGIKLMSYCEEKEGLSEIRWKIHKCLRCVQFVCSTVLGLAGCHFLYSHSVSHELNCT